ncbi:MAG: FixH family protein [Burkholderiales bacterium]
MPIPQSLPVRSEPWYREPWPWILMAGPFAAIAAGIVTYALALQSENSLVAGNYYKEGLGINRVIEREQKARLLGYEAQLSFPSRQTVRVQLRAMGQLPEELRLRLIHPTQAQHDHEMRIARREQGIYEGPLARAGLASSSKWYFHIEDDGGTWRVAGEWEAEQGSHAKRN